MSQHILTITLVIEVPDDEHAAIAPALARAANELLDDGALVDWIIDAAGEIDDTDMDDVISCQATCAMRKATAEEQVEVPERSEDEEDEES